MATSYLDLVNAVLLRVREPTVQTVSQSSYSQLIGEMVNETKREVEDSWNWAILRTTKTITTSATVYGYEIPSTNPRTKVLSVYLPSAHMYLEKVSEDRMNTLLFVNPTQAGRPYYYSFGSSTPSTGVLTLNVFPIPDQAYTIKVECVVPQEDLVNDLDNAWLPKDMIVQGAYLRAINERGEDGGRLSDQQSELYRKTVANYISIEAERFKDEITWDAV
jgi:hypothetical protein